MCVCVCVCVGVCVGVCLRYLESSKMTMTRFLAEWTWTWRTNKE